MKKTRIAMIVLALVLSLCMTSAALAASAPKTAVQSFKVTLSEMKVLIGQTSEPLTFAIKPASEAEAPVTWASEDETIAVVDESGAVTGVSAGKTKVTATVTGSDEQTKTASCTVTVLTPVASITPDAAELKLAKGEKATMKAAVLPEDAASKKVTWSTSDKAIAQVTASGAVTASGVGSAVLTCEADDGSGVKAEVSVTVYQPVKSVAIVDRDTDDLASVGKEAKGNVGDMFRWGAKIAPDDAEYTDVVWTSSDPDVASIDQNGVVILRSAGKTTITATSAEPVSGKTKAKAASCKLTVAQPVKSILLTIDHTKTTDTKIVFKAEVLPANATNPKLKWSSDNKQIIVKKGVVTAKKHTTPQGKVIVEATDGSGVVATCDVKGGFVGMQFQAGKRVYYNGLFYIDALEETIWNGNRKDLPAPAEEADDAAKGDI